MGEKRRQKKNGVEQRDGCYSGTCFCGSMAMVGVHWGALKQWAAFGSALPLPFPSTLLLLLPPSIIHLFLLLLLFLLYPLSLRFRFRFRFRFFLLCPQFPTWPLLPLSLWLTLIYPRKYFSLFLYFSFLSFFTLHELGCFVVDSGA